MSAESCGRWVTLRFVEGYAAEETWCQRISGPCPYPGANTVDGRTQAERERNPLRPCAASRPVEETP